MHKIDRSSGMRKGSILPLMVVLLLVLLLSSLATMQVGRDSRTRALKSKADIAARYAADAGIARTLFLMNQSLANKTWSSSALPSFTAEPLLGGNASYTAGVSGSLAMGYEILSVGRSRDAVRTIRVTLELTNPFALNFAVLTEHSITMDGNTRIQAYNSMDISQTGLRADIGTLSDAGGSIDIKNGASISGDVYVGLVGDPQDVVQMKSRTDVQGELFNQPPPLPELVSISAPTYLVNKGKLSGENITLASTDSGIYDSIDISNTGKLRIEGDCVLVVTGDIRLKNSAEIQITPTGSLVIYLEGDFIGDYSAGIRNETATPSKFKLFGTGTNQQILLKNSMDFYGVIYAPDADVIIYNGGDLYGSLVVESFEMKNSGSVYYDVALQNVSIGDEAAMFRIIKWEEF